MQNLSYKKYIVGLGLLIYITVGCQTYAFNDNNKPTPLATVYGEHLFLSEVPNLSSVNNSDDSLDIIESYVKYWVDKKVFEQNAINALGDKIKTIDQLVEQYRSSLINQYYENELLISTNDIVTDDDIEAYYNKNKDKMLLNREIVKAQVLIMPKNYSQQKATVQKFVSGKEDALNDIISIANRDSLKIFDYNSNWIDATQVFNNVPFEKMNMSIKNFLIRGRYFDMEDGNYRYLLKVNRYALVGNYKPLEMIKDDIKHLIINERKEVILKNTKDNITKRAVEEGNAKYNIDVELQGGGENNILNKLNTSYSL